MMTVTRSGRPFDKNALAPITPHAALRRAAQAEEIANAQSTGTSVIDLRAAHITQAVIRTNDPDIIVQEISTLWTHIQRSSLAIGEYLLTAKALIEEQARTANASIGDMELRVITAANYRRQILSRVPFGDKVAHQLMKAAEFVRENQKLAPRLPWNYSVVYQISTLKPSELEAADSQEVINPGVTREEILTFKRKFRTDRLAAKDALLDRQQKLRAAREKLDHELTKIEEELRNYSDISQP
jgi:hypothetical protein